MPSRLYREQGSVKACRCEGVEWTLELEEEQLIAK
jgi:hypothetical protein